MEHFGKILTAHHRKIWLLLTGVITLSFVLIQLLLISYSSMQQTAEEERKAVYGSWHAAVLGADVETIDRIKTHATIQHYGISSFFGHVLGNEGEELPKIGYVDDLTAEMEPIELMKGEFPDSPDEAAVELSYLTALGYEAELNQELTLPVEVVNKETEESEIIQLKFRLCGIVTDYSRKMKGTSLDKLDYVSFFISPDHELTQYQMRGNLVMQLEDSYVETYTELMDLVSNRLNLVGNNYTYFQMSGESEYQMSVDAYRNNVTIAVIILICTFVGAGFIWSYINHEKQLWYVCTSLGATMGRIKLQIMYQLFKHLLVGCLCGSLIGVVLSRLIYQIVSLHMNISWAVPVENIVIWSSIDLLAFCVISGLALLVPQEWKQISQIHCTVHPKAEIVEGVDYRKMKKKIAAVYRGYQIKTSILSGVLLIVVGLAMGVTWEKKVDYEKIQSSRVADYEFGSTFKIDRTKKHITSEQYEQLSRVYGVEAIEALKSLDYLKVENHENDNMNSCLETDSIINGYAVGIQIDGEAYEYYLKEVDCGNVDRSSFSQGAEVIVSIPEIESEKAVSLMYEEMDTSEYKDKIHVGDKIKISYGNQFMYAKVGGIIYEYHEDSIFQSLKRPFIVIGSNSFIKKLIPQQDTYEHLFVYTNNYLYNRKQAKIELSTIRGLVFVDNETIVEDYQKTYIKYMLMLGVLCSIASLILLFIRVFLWSNNKKRIHDFLENHFFLAGDMHVIKTNILKSKCFILFICLQISSMLILGIRLFYYFSYTELPREKNFLLFLINTRHLWINERPYITILVVGIAIFFLEIAEKNENVM